MKPRRTWRRSCRNKCRYRSFGEANRDAKALTKKDGHPMSVYLCDYCGHYHVGHTPYWIRERKP